MNKDQLDKYIELLQEISKNDKNKNLEEKPSLLGIFNNTTLAIFYIFYGIITAGVVIKYFIAWFVNPIFDINFQISIFNAGVLYFCFAFVSGRFYNKPQTDSYSIFEAFILPWVILLLGYILSFGVNYL